MGLNQRRTAPTDGPPRWLVAVPLAHRGLHGRDVPENSLAAFAAARAAGYGVELDVQLTRDGVPVVVHDPVLTRTTGRAVRVAEATAAALAALRLEGTDEAIPTLADALAVLDDAPVMVEVKSLRLRAGATEPAVAALLDRHPGPVCVASFNPATLRWFRRRRPQLPRVLTSGPQATFGALPAPVRRRLADLRDLPTVDPVAVSYALDGLPSAATDRWREAGGALVAWTAASPEQLTRAHEVADNVIFEHVRPRVT